MAPLVLRLSDLDGIIIIPLASLGLQFADGGSWNFSALVPHEKEIHPCQYRYRYISCWFCFWGRTLTYTEGRIISKHASKSIHSTGFSIFWISPIVIMFGMPVKTAEAQASPPEVLILRVSPAPCIYYAQEVSQSILWHPVCSLTWENQTSEIVTLACTCPTFGPCKSWEPQ